MGLMGAAPAARSGSGRPARYQRDATRRRRRVKRARSAAASPLPALYSPRRGPSPRTAPCMLATCMLPARGEGPEARAELVDGEAARDACAK